jgi:hypothetical protein
MKIEHWHRRRALSLASQLPDGPGDALAILECVRELVVTFLHRKHRNQRPGQKFYRSSEIAKNFEPEAKQALRLTSGGFLPRIVLTPDFDHASRGPRGMVRPGARRPPLTARRAAPSDEYAQA